MKKTKKGSAGLLICSIIALIMVLYGSFITYRGVGAVLLSAPENSLRVYFSLFKFLLGAIFVIGTLLIGKKSEKKGVAIAFSIVNMLIGLAAFLPVRGYYVSISHLGFLFRQNAGAGVFCVLPYVFYALIMLFALLTMLAALKKDRRQPKGLCTLILITTGVYALISVVSLLFSSPYLFYRLRFQSAYGLRNITMFFRYLSMGRLHLDLLLNPFSSTAHVLFPFATIPVLLAMFFAAKSIRPSETAKALIEEEYTAAPACETAPAAQDSGKNKVAAAILAGVLGNIGVHRFYLGYAGAAVVQLLGGIAMMTGYIMLMTAGMVYDPSVSRLVFSVIFVLFGCGTGIWAFVDFIRILCNRLLPANGAWAGFQPQALAPQTAYAAPQDDLFTPKAEYTAPQPEFTAPEPVFTEPQPEPVFTESRPEPAVRPEPVVSENNIDRIERELNQLNAMRDRGLITEDEYIALRKNILGA